MSGWSAGASLCLFATVVGAPIVRASAASISLVFLTGNEILKMYLKIMERVRMKHKKISLLAKSKPNSIEEIISKALENAETRHEEITLFRNEEEN